MQLSGLQAEVGGGAVRVGPVEKGGRGARAASWSGGRGSAGGIGGERRWREGKLGLSVVVIEN